MLGIPQEYDVPIGTGDPVGFKLNNTPEQVVREVEEIFAAGNTVTVTVNPAELQPLGTFGVTKQVAVPTALPEFVKVPLKLDALVPPTPIDIVPSVVGALQLQVVPDGIVPVNEAVKATPEQVLNVTLLIAAVGNTLTVTVKPAEVQPPGTVGVTK